MALNISSHPEITKLKAEIEALAGDRQRMDRFFWLKAARDDDRAGIRLFHGADPGDGKRVFRIANIVLQGGGVLGLAHAGFVAGLETANIRFAGVAGASAGAIMAMGIVAVRGSDLLKPTHAELVRIVGEMPMAAFIDGPYRTRRLIKQFLLKRLSLRPSAWLAWLGALGQILRKRGLNPGHAFEDWLSGVLAEHELRTVNDLFDRLEGIGELLNKAKAGNRGSPIYDTWRLDRGNKLGADLLQIVAACTPVGVKFQFPRDVDCLSVETKFNSPAALVRASMSIPLFFEPAVFDVAKDRWKAFIDDKLGPLVEEKKREELSEIEQVAFLDGGIFSNLPVDAFSDVMPDVPTVAVPLASASLAKPYKRRARLKSLVEDVGSVAFMVRNQRDRDAIEHLNRARKRFELRQQASGAARRKVPPSHPFRLVAINVGDANWLNFVMDEPEMMELFLAGLRRARDFLCNDL